MDIISLKNTLGMSMSVIGGEHFFSAGLSSPWSVAKFAESDDDQKDVWKYFNDSAASSMVFGSILSLTLGSIWPVAGSAATVLYYRHLYSGALNKASQNGLKKSIESKGLSKTINEITKSGSIDEIKRLSEFIAK